MSSRDPDNSQNILIALVLSMLVLFVWQYFYAGPKMEAEKTRIEREAASKSADPAKPQAAQAPVAPPDGSAPRTPSAAPGEAPAVAAPGAPVAPPAEAAKVTRNIHACAKHACEGYPTRGDAGPDVRQCFPMLPYNSVCRSRFCSSCRFVRPWGWWRAC